jgi:DNA-binding protein HU-beta
MRFDTETRAGIRNPFDTPWGASYVDAPVVQTKGGETNMNKTELIATVAKKTGLSAREARAAVETLFSPGKEGLIAAALMSGKKVQITGFGTFETRKRKARDGRNPQTGERIKIAASRFPAFHAGKALKERIKK